MYVDVVLWPLQANPTAASESTEEHPPIMCTYALVHHVRCGHTVKCLKKYCHFARNDPNHQCFGAWSIKENCEQEKYECEKCEKDRLYAQQFYGGSG